ncbi:WXG100 family type VII secretion target [Rhodococcus sp. NPDC127528]|uniref:WXG100 family type VII secretion target n=1 Tax=unclassified Rhodococcus (in: high G+C Gram-positive bacteria) TaxID=192944 RepID=UPI00363B7F45
MGEILYNFGAIEAAAAGIKSTSAVLDTTLADLKKYVASLAVVWGGSGAESYQQYQAQWDSAAAELHQVLEAIGRAVGTGNDDMNATDRAAASSWS